MTQPLTGIPLSPLGHAAAPGCFKSTPSDLAILPDTQGPENLKRAVTSVLSERLAARASCYRFFLYFDRHAIYPFVVFMKDEHEADERSKLKTQSKKSVVRESSYCSRNSYSLLGYPASGRDWENGTRK